MLFQDRVPRKLYIIYHKHCFVQVIVHGDIKIMAQRDCAMVLERVSKMRNGYSIK